MKGCGLLLVFWVGTMFCLGCTPVPKTDPGGIPNEPAPSVFPDRASGKGAAGARFPDGP